VIVNTLLIVIFYGNYNKTKLPKFIAFHL